MYSCSRQISQGTQRVHSVRTPRKTQYNLTPCSRNNNSLVNDNSDDEDEDNDNDSIFNGLKSPRKNNFKNNPFNSFDSLDHLLNDKEEEKEEEEEEEDEDEMIDKYIGDDNDLIMELDTSHYCSNTLMTAIRSISSKSDEKEDEEDE